MSLKNNVQLIGNVGQAPVIKTLESGKKLARFSLATNEYWKNKEGEKQTSTNWHTLTAWGPIADLVEKHVSKGKEIAVVGKLKSGSYETEDGSTRYTTEVEVSEILFLGNKQNQTEKETAEDKE